MVCGSCQTHCRAAGLGLDCINEGLQVLCFVLSDPSSFCFSYLFSLSYFLSFTSREYEDYKFITVHSFQEMYFGGFIYYHFANTFYEDHIYRALWGH